MRFSRCKAWSITLVVFTLLLQSFITAAVLNNELIQLVHQENGLVESNPTLAPQGWSSLSSDEIYAEDFTSPSYLDAANTNASGWGTGTLSLPKQTADQVGFCNFSTNVYGVYVSGDYAYVAAQTAGLQVINITNPSQPYVVDSSGAMVQAVDVWVSGDYAYVCDWDAGVHVYNVTNPSDISFVVTYNTPGWATGVWIDGDYAYVSDNTAGLTILDITDPTNPSLAGSCATTRAKDVCVSGNYAYVADYESGLRVIDISDPTNPSSVTACDTPGEAWSVSVSGNYAYIADQNAGLQVINVSDPSHPSLIGSYYTSLYATELCVSGNLVYVADQNSGLHIINVTDPSQPSLAGFSSTPRHAQDVFVQGEFAYVVTWYDEYYPSGFYVIQIADSTPAKMVGSCSFSGFANGVFVDGHYAYVADGSSGLRVVDIIDPDSPILVGTYATPATCLSVYVSGNYAYATAWNYGLYVVNVTDPQNPTYAGHCSTGGSTDTVFVSGNYAYIAQGGGLNGLFVVDISDPTNPSVAGSYITTEQGRGVFVEGDYAYLATESAKFYILDISTPSSPTYVTTLTTSHTYLTDVFVDGNYAYLTASQDNSGMDIINITDPTNPTVISHIASGSAMAVFVEGNYAYFAHFLLSIANITNPCDATKVETYSWTGDSAYGVYVEGDYAYIGDGPNGLTIVEIQASRFRQFESQAVAQSLTVHSGQTLTHATLNPTETQFLNTSTAYYLSADDGLHWELVMPGVEHIFENSGTQLRWRAVFTTTDWRQSPILSNINIVYNTKLDAPVLASPSDGVGIGDNTPFLQWTDAYVDASYLVQLDTVTSFDSVDLTNVTVPVGWKNCTSPMLADGLWYWRVAANDTGGDLGFFSLTWNMTIDTTAPMWDHTPADIILDYNEPLDYQLEVSDLSGIDSCEINDTTHFSIDATGHIVNATALESGTYGVMVTVYDPYGNHLSGEFLITVLEQPTSTTTTTTSTESLDLGPLIIVLGGLGGVVLIVIVVVLMKRRPAT